MPRANMTWPASLLGWLTATKQLTAKEFDTGDVLLALPSVGLHTNGYSLARKLFFEVAGYDVDTRLG